MSFLWLIRSTFFDYTVSGGPTHKILLKCSSGPFTGQLDRVAGPGGVDFVGGCPSPWENGLSSELASVSKAPEWVLLSSLIG